MTPSRARRIWARPQRRGGASLDRNFLFALGDRDWAVTVPALPEFGNAPTLATWVVLIGGLGLTALGTAVLLTWSRRARQVQLLVE